MRGVEEGLKGEVKEWVTEEGSGGMGANVRHNEGSREERGEGKKVNEK